MADWTKTRFNLRYHWATITLRIVSLVAAHPPGPHGEVEYIPIRTLVLRIVAFVCLMLGIGVSQGDAWVKDYQPFPAGEATVIVWDECWDEESRKNDLLRYCHRVSIDTWEATVRAAFEAWNAVSNFRFSVRSRRSTDDPCRNIPGQVVVILSDILTVCPSDQTPGVAWGFVERGAGWAQVYINPILFTWLSDNGLYRVLLHESGHLLGLGHPDEAGQMIRTVMNGNALPSEMPDTLQPDDIAGARALWPFQEEPAALVGFLGNPRDGSSQSGIGVISGWVCEAGIVEISIWPPDGGKVFVEEAAYGTSRPDTAYTKDGAEICGDTDNGFGLLFNWNRLEEEEYVVDVLVDGELLDRATVSLTNFGQEFLRRVSGRYVLEDFPYPGESVVVEWEEGLQNFVIVERR